MKFSINFGPTVVNIDSGWNCIHIFGRNCALTSFMILKK